MRTFLSFFALVILVHSARGGCRDSNWWDILDKNNVWATCHANEYITGFWRSANGGFGWLFSDDRLGRLEMAKCCTAPQGNANADCVDADWWHSFDKNNNWNVCPAGRFLQAFYKSNDKWLHNIEHGRCCKPPGNPDAWDHCYDQDVTHSFDHEGWSMCNAGYYLVGLYRGGCDRLYCIEHFRCCKMRAKPVNGGWSQFGDWGACSKDCGGGTQSRSRTCTNPPPAHGGAQCAGSASESQDCNTQPCPVDGGWSEFGDWGECSAKCGDGHETRSRTCTNPPPAHGGAVCSGPAEESRDCHGDDCVVNGGWSDWSAYGKCTKRGRKCKMYRTRTCTDPPPSGGGKKCKGKPKKGKKCKCPRILMK